ncbi:MAG TPA: UDP-N-acetylglucosamine 1-carboxyvinyltransferase [Vicinamibacterales bacterium]|nr:UDP-N-acetylglucosamine 1-carboxyvinyltransferase [Vicinamibacterales bacterium]
MADLHIEGGRRIEGRVTVEGSKNAALPLIAACLLSEDWCELDNVPRIRDVEVMCKLLESLGADVEGVGTPTLRIRAPKLSSSQPSPELVGKLRGSVLLLGPILGRMGKATIAPPGGDFPARRTISTHVQALVEMGARVVDAPGHAVEAPDGLKASSFYLLEASVTGTETALLAAACAQGPVEMRHVATEPHVVEVCRFLEGMGVKIDGIGTSTLRLEPPKKLRGTKHRLSGDYLEAGSWGVCAAVTGGELEVTGARFGDMEPMAVVLRQMGMEFDLEDDRFHVKRSKLVCTPRITTGLWPSFPSDYVSLVSVLATQAEGKTLIHDWMYELRLFALEQLSSMRANLFLCDPHRIIVTGPTKLKGRTLDSRDIRSGMALIAAALCADGKSIITPVEIVERGYASVVDKLQSLGAQVERVSGGRRATDEK